MERGREAKTRRLAAAANEADAEVVRVTMTMTKCQHRAIKRFALDNDTTASGLVQEWIDRYCVGVADAKGRGWGCDVRADEAN